MNNFELVIGIEIHIELNTKTKMFSSAPNNFDALPNDSVALLDLAYPGTLPLVNKEAVKKAIKLAKALEMKISDVLQFDRKNYFYADLPKGFQITQMNNPIGKGGKIPIGNNKSISIERIQLEEDTAKSNHDGDFTRLDYNRSGTPLIEIISNPVINSVEDAIAYIDQIKKTARLLNISEAKMEKGSMRADINISLRPHGSKELFTRVEIKNLNSLSNVVKAIEMEVQIQTKKYLSGEQVLLATKRFDESSQKNVIMRVKMEEADYRFFPEPNIPLIQLDKEMIECVEALDLPWEIKDKLLSLGLSEEYANQIINDRNKWVFIKELLANNKIDFVKAIKIYFAEVIPFALKQKLKLMDIQTEFFVENFLYLINKLDEGEISGSHVKKIIPILIKDGELAAKIIVKNNFKQISDIDVLTNAIDKIYNDNVDFIQKNIESRPDRVEKFVLGLLMKETQGRANMVKAKLVWDKKLIEKH